MENIRDEAIRDLEKDTQMFMESAMGKRIANTEYEENYDDITEVLINLEEPLTTTVSRLREGNY